MQRVPELGVLAHPVAVAPNRDQVAVVDKPIDQRRRHHVITEDFAPLLGAPGRLKARPSSGARVRAPACDHTTP
jgi:hypothetical protein